MEEDLLLTSLQDFQTIDTLFQILRQINELATVDSGKRSAFVRSEEQIVIQRALAKLLSTLPLHECFNKFANRYKRSNNDSSNTNDEIGNKMEKEVVKFLCKSYSAGSRGLVGTIIISNLKYSTAILACLLSAKEYYSLLDYVINTWPDRILMQSLMLLMASSSKYQNIRARISKCLSDLLIRREEGILVLLNLLLASNGNYSAAEPDREITLNVINLIKSILVQNEDKDQKLEETVTAITNQLVNIIVKVKGADGYPKISIHILNEILGNQRYRDSCNEALRKSLIDDRISEAFHYLVNEGYGSFENLSLSLDSLIPKVFALLVEFHRSQSFSFTHARDILKLFFLKSSDHFLFLLLLTDSPAGALSEREVLAVFDNICPSNDFKLAVLYHIWKYDRFSGLRNMLIKFLGYVEMSVPFALKILRVDYSIDYNGTFIKDILRYLLNTNTEKIFEHAGNYEDLLNFLEKLSQRMEDNETVSLAIGLIGQLELAKDKRLDHRDERKTELFEIFSIYAEEEPEAKAYALFRLEKFIRDDGRDVISGLGKTPQIIQILKLGIKEQEELVQMRAISALKTYLHAFDDGINASTNLESFQPK